MWQRPEEFIPDRFDNASPLSKTSAGEKRPMTAWVPFNGGKRICFGKTFADIALRVICTMMAQTFDFKFVEEGKYSNESMPQIVLGQTNYLPLHIKLTKYNRTAKK